MSRSLGGVILLCLAFFKIIKSNVNKKTKIILVILSIFTLNLSAGIYFIKTGKSGFGWLIISNLFVTILLFHLILRIGAGLTMY